MSNETENKDQPVKAEMEAFFTADNAEQGVEMPLALNGKPSAEFLIVRGADSKTFKRAKSVTDRKNLDLMRDLSAKKIDQAQLAVKQAQLEVELIKSLVVGWSFDIEFNDTNLTRFFKNAPYIPDVVNGFAGQREHFFSKPSSD